MSNFSKWVVENFSLLYFLIRFNGLKEINKY